MIGSNDAPIVAGPVVGAATEGGGIVTISGIANATDIDHGAVLSVVAAALRLALVSPSAIVQ